MPDVPTLGVVAAASLFLAIVPGPAVIYIVTRSVSQGRAAGIVSVAGIHVGTLVHVLAAVLGLSALVLRSALAFSAVKYAGAAYLLYLGVRELRSKSDEDGRVAVCTQPLAKIFRQGIIVNIFNIKTGLFFLAFLPQFVDPSRDDVPLQLFVLGSVFIMVAMCSDLIYALVSSGLSGRLRSSSRFARGQRLVAGGVYIGLGVTAAFSGNRSNS